MVTWSKENIEACKGWFETKFQKGPEEDCWPWQGAPDSDGYGQASWEGRKVTASKLAHILYKGPVPTGYMVCHTCDNPPCVNPVHLWAGTYSENQQDMLRKGRYVYTGSPGSSNPCSKLDETKVKEIRKRHNEGASSVKLATEYSVSRVTIWGIVSGKAWKHVQGG